MTDNNKHPRLSIIVAITDDGAIGRGGDLVYRLRPDMRRFRSITMGHPVIMGRKTWESLPAGALPGRRNIVISRNPGYEAQGAEVFSSLEAALGAISPDEEAMVIGGAQIYRQAMPLADRLYLTRINAPAPGADTFFPEIDPARWAETDPGEQQTDPETQIRYRFSCLSRR